MKKKLEADLISIAHRILKLKNKSDVNQLYIETQKLYEKLSILRFVEEHFGDAKPTIGQAEIVQKMQQFFENNTVFEFDTKKITEEISVEAIDNESIVDEGVNFEIEIAEEQKSVILEIEDGTEQEEAITEPSPERNEVHFSPAFELDNDDESEENIQTEKAQISFLDLLGEDYSDTLFVKVEPTNEMPPAIPFDIPKKGKQKVQDVVTDVILEEKEVKTVSISEKLSHGINIGLNDRIGFVKHLFANSDEDFNRVLNQLITYDSFEEANDFIENMVKPDYNNWVGKEDYAQRFIEIIENKFA